MGDKIKAKAAAKDDSVSCPCCTPYSPPIPISVPPTQGCSNGFQRDSNGNCVQDSVTDPLPSSCPSGYTSDGYGNCLPPQSVVRCADGYSFD
jgi:hypothetical protein